MCFVTSGQCCQVAISTSTHRYKKSPDLPKIPKLQYPYAGRWRVYKGPHAGRVFDTPAYSIATSGLHGPKFSGPARPDDFVFLSARPDLAVEKSSPARPG